MAHANPYTPGQVETLEEAKNELVKLAAVVNQSIANQKLLQRDDGCLADCAVVPHTLSDEVVRMIGHFELLGAYAARPYQKGQVVTYQNRMYVCVAPHQGGTVMDTAAWRLIGKAGCGCEGEAAGYDVGYAEGEAAGKAAGDAAGYARGYPEGDAAGKAAGDAAGYARGYPEGEAAGKASCSGSGSGGSGGGSDGLQYIYKQTAYGSVRYGSTPKEACSGVMTSYNFNMRLENGTCNAYNSDGTYARNFGVPEKILLKNL